MNQGGNYWTLFTPGIWKVLHAVLHSKRLWRLQSGSRAALSGDLSSAVGLWW